jgi:hypothetical protein
MTKHELYCKQIDLAKKAQHNARLKAMSTISQVCMVTEWGNTIAKLERERDALTVEDANVQVKA